jgi:hypothetical protein
MASSITMPYMKKSLEDLLLFVKERKAAMSLDPCRLTFEGRSTSSLGRVRSALAGALAVWRSNGAPPSYTVEPAPPPPVLLWFLFISDIHYRNI